MQKNLLVTLKEQVSFYLRAVDHHLINSLIKNGEMPRSVLDDCARMHYGFSTSWGPVLGTIKDTSTNFKFIEALKENMSDELGINGISHITLCADLLKSMGIDPHYGGNDMLPIAAHPVEIMNTVPFLTEAQKAGYMFLSESLVPHVFTVLKPAYDQINADTRYFSEHMEVDSDKHSVMLQEALEDIIKKSKDTGIALGEALQGIHFGGRSIVGPIDCFYFEALRLQK